MLSLRYGNGDTRWFDKLPRDEQTRLLGYLVVDVERAKGRTYDPRDQDAERLHREADEARPKSADDVLRRRLEQLKRGGR